MTMSFFLSVHSSEVLCVCVWWIFSESDFHANLCAGPLSWAGVSCEKIGLLPLRSRLFTPCLVNSLTFWNWTLYDGTLSWLKRTCKKFGLPSCQSQSDSSDPWKLTFFFYIFWTVELLAINHCCWLTWKMWGRPTGGLINQYGKTFKVAISQTLYIW